MDGVFFAPDGPGVQLISLRTHSTDRKLQIILLSKRSFGLVRRIILRNQIIKILSAETNLEITKKQGRGVLHRHRAQPLQL